METFRPAWWLRGAHRQTLWGPLARPTALVPFTREIAETPDGDEVVLDHVASGASGPRVLLLHGLEGSSYSPYAQGLCLRFAALGWRPSVIHFRSCARETDRLTWIANRRPRLYWSGDTGDFDFIARRFRAAEPQAPLFAAGVSIGGNVLLKWLGENPGQAIVDAAATLSVPYDLAAGCRHLERRGGRVYVASFLRTLRAKAERIVARFPETANRIDLERARVARDFWSFDDAATAPLHGFAGAGDYYARCSSLAFVERITTPTFCLSAADDPFLPRAILEQMRGAASSAVELLVTPQGGHVGFVGGRSPFQPQYWAEERIVAWMEARVVS